mmetsp:Transcript_66789/g.175100  ORF Transcript_66789/g.175100 Transcript_66789/m.175100 type:complete len:288 (-) Transcript_66789:4-867(-)
MALGRSRRGAPGALGKAVRGPSRTPWLQAVRALGQGGRPRDEELQAVLRLDQFQELLGRTRLAVHPEDAVAPSNHWVAPTGLPLPLRVPRRHGPAAHLEHLQSAAAWSEVHVHAEAAAELVDRHGVKLRPPHVHVRGELRGQRPEHLRGAAPRAVHAGDEVPSAQLQATHRCAVLVVLSRDANGIIADEKIRVVQVIQLEAKRLAIQPHKPDIIQGAVRARGNSPRALPVVRLDLHHSNLANRGNDLIVALRLRNGTAQHRNTGRALRPTWMRSLPSHASWACASMA